MTVCGGKKRDGGICQRPAGWGTDHVGSGFCKLHNGNVAKGAEHPNFKHGAYSKYAASAIADKIADFPEGDALSLVGELSLLRALLAAFLDKYKDAALITESLDSITKLTESIRKTTDSIVKQRNDTALTAVEIAFIMSRLPDLVVKYIAEPDKQQQFLADLFGVFGGSRPGVPTGQPALADVAGETD
jgi:hypothetical protein